MHPKPPVSNQSLTLTEMLADFGIRHERSAIEGKHNLYNSTSGHIGTFDAKEAFEYLRLLAAQKSNSDPDHGCCGGCGRSHKDQCETCRNLRDGSARTSRRTMSQFVTEADYEAAVKIDEIEAFCTGHVEP